MLFGCDPIRLWNREGMFVPKRAFGGVQRDELFGRFILSFTPVDVYQVVFFKRYEVNVVRPLPDILFELCRAWGVVFDHGLDGANTILNLRVIDLLKSQFSPGEVCIVAGTAIELRNEGRKSG